jgi:subtilisin family serine protease
MDCNGHGSHVAGSAAGNGVNADFSTYTGPYDGSLNTLGMHIGPGVAPRAGIYAVRLFGCAGSTAVTAQAIEWATDPNRDGNPSDHVDVINMSLGSAYGTPDDPSAAASNTAAAAGVIVVTSAGNNTDVTYVTGSPGSAVRALSTASSVDEWDRAEAIVVHSPAAIAGKYIGAKSVNFNWIATPTRTGNVYYPTTNRFGCSAWTGADAANIAGRIVLVDWKVGNDPFPCGSTVRANNAGTAGAIGIIMADSTTWIDTAIGGNTTVPAMYTTIITGNALKSQLTPGVVNPAVSATLDSQQYGEANEPGRIDQLSVFSSRGPRARDTGLKPDIAAPGQSIWSVGNGSGFRGATNQGTSMASPHMAGVMALLKSAHPGRSVEQLKALAMNTAQHDLYTGLGKTGDLYGPARVGAGRVDTAAALRSHSVAYNADGSGAVSVSFGAVEVAGSLSMTRTIRIANFDSSAHTYDVDFVQRYGIPGVTYSFPDGNVVSVPGGGAATFRVQLNANAAAMQNTRDATIAGVQAGNPRQWLSEASGLVLIRAQGRGPQTLRVPVYAAARPASTTKALEADVNLGRSGGNTGTITMTGTGVNTGAEPLGYLSKVSAFELGITSGMETLGAGVSPLARNADIQYAGAATKGAGAARTVYFGLATHGDWATPATDVAFTIQVDRNGDGTADVSPFNTRFTDADVFVTAVGASAVGFTNIFNSNVNTAPFNNSVLVMPVPVSALGLPAGQSSFRYRIVGASRFWGTIDTTPWARYDHLNQGVDFADGLAGTTMYPDVAGQQIGVTHNAANFAANGSQGVLLLHHFGKRGERTEVLGFVRTRGFGR